MTPQQIELVQTSFKKVVPIAGTAADLFYGRLDRDLHRPRWGHDVNLNYCAAILDAAGAKSRSISRRSFTAVSVSSIATSA